MNAAVLPWRGIHHLALVTPDLDATLRFYNEIMEMPVSEIYPSREGRGRHAFVFVKPGDSETWGLHFFERSIEQPASDALLHIAFGLPHQAAAHALRDRAPARHRSHRACRTWRQPVLFRQHRPHAGSHLAEAVTQHHWLL
jgi:catechol 2,3-dioxygenase-like lactoylglutathione lyase family enzyme